MSDKREKQTTATDAKSPPDMSRVMAALMQFSSRKLEICGRLDRGLTPADAAKSSYLAELRSHPLYATLIQHEPELEIVTAEWLRSARQEFIQPNTSSIPKNPSSSDPHLPLGGIRDGGGNPTVSCADQCRRITNHEEEEDAEEAEDRLWETDPEQAMELAEQRAWSDYVDSGKHALHELLPMAAEEAKKLKSSIEASYRAILDSTQSKKTEEEYWRIGMREWKRQNSFDVSESVGPNRRKRFNALLIYVHDNLNSRIDLAQSCHIFPDEAIVIVQEIDALISVGKRLIESFDAEPKKERRKRQKFRRRISGLPEGWEFELEVAARTHIKWYFSICLMLTAGLRPQDIANRVVVSAVADDRIKIAVNPAKQRDARGEVGLGRREMIFRADAPWTAALLRHCSNSAGGSAQVSVRSTKSAYDILVNISRRIFPTAPKPVTPLVLRHRFASLLKNGEYDLRTKLKALGHASPASLSRYGAKGIRTSNVGALLEVSSEREPHDF